MLRVLPLLVTLYLAAAVGNLECWAAREQLGMNITTAAIKLPSPKTAGRFSLEELIARRRSVREFTGETLTLEEVSQLLWSAQGVTHPAGYRAVPSAGALYPLELYVASRDGVYHYDPARHLLRRHRGEDARPALAAASLGQESVSEAAAVFVIAAVYERTAGKYGAQRAQRYVVLEAGHAAQNLLLESVGLGLGAVPIGAFSDREVERVLSLPPGQRAIYLIPVGHPR